MSSQTQEKDHSYSPNDEAMMMHPHLEFVGQRPVAGVAEEHTGSNQDQDRNASSLSSSSATRRHRSMPLSQQRQVESARLASATASNMGTTNPRPAQHQYRQKISMPTSTDLSASKHHSSLAIPAPVLPPPVAAAISTPRPLINHNLLAGQVPAAPAGSASTVPSTASATATATSINQHIQAPTPNHSMFAAPTKAPAAPPDIAEWLLRDEEEIQQESAWNRMLKKLVEYKKLHPNLSEHGVQDPSLARWLARQCQQFVMLEHLGVDFHVGGFRDKPTTSGTTSSAMIAPPHVPPLVSAPSPAAARASYPEEMPAHMLTVTPPERADEVQPPPSNTRLDEQWNEKFVRLVQFYKTNGHVDVPSKYPADQKLSNWVSNVRHCHRKGNLRADRLACLNAIGFGWTKGKGHNTTIINNDIVGATAPSATTTQMVAADSFSTAPMESVQFAAIARRPTIAATIDTASPSPVLPGEVVDRPFEATAPLSPAAAPAALPIPTAATDTETFNVSTNRDINTSDATKVIASSQEPTSNTGTNPASAITAVAGNGHSAFRQEVQNGEHSSNDRDGENQRLSHEHGPSNNQEATIDSLLSGNHGQETQRVPEVKNTQDRDRPSAHGDNSSCDLFSSDSDDDLGAAASLGGDDPNVLSDSDNDGESVDYDISPCASAEDQLQQWKEVQAEFNKMVPEEEAMLVQWELDIARTEEQRILGQLEITIEGTQPTADSQNLSSPSQPTGDGSMSLKHHGSSKVRLLDDLWNHMFDKLKDYKDIKGDCLVPNPYHADIALARWVSLQRESFREGVLSPDRRQRLEGIGFVWDPGHGKGQGPYKSLASPRINQENADSTSQFSDTNEDTMDEDMTMAKEGEAVADLDEDATTSELFTSEDDELEDGDDFEDAEVANAREEAILERLDREISQAEAAEAYNRTRPSQDEVNVEASTGNGEEVEMIAGGVAASPKSVSRPKVAGRQHELALGARSTIYVTLLREAKFGGLVMTKEDVASFMASFQNDAKRDSIEWSVKIPPSKGYLFELTASGPASTMNTLKSKAKKWSSYRGQVAKLKAILDDEESLVFEIHANWEKLGIALIDWSEELPRNLICTDAGGFPFNVDPFGLVSERLGPKVSRVCAAVIRVDNKYFERHEAIMEYLDKKKGAFVKVTICAHKETPLQPTSPRSPGPQMRTLREFRKVEKLQQVDSTSSETQPLHAKDGKPESRTPTVARELSINLDGMLLDMSGPVGDFGIAIVDGCPPLVDVLHGWNGKCFTLNTTDDDGTVSRLLGRDLKSYPAAILFVDSQIFDNFSELMTYLKKRKDEGGVMKLTVLLHQDHDLSLGSGQLPEITRIRQLAPNVETLEDTLEAYVGPRDEDLLTPVADDAEYPSALPENPPRTEREIDDSVRRIMSDEKSVEVEVFVPVDMLGATFTDREVDGKMLGWIAKFLPGLPLGSALGKELGSWGAIPFAINGARIHDIEQFKRMKKRLGNVGSIKLTLICFDGVNLNNVDRSKLARAPRRRNGQKYPLRPCLPPTSEKTARCVEANSSGNMPASPSTDQVGGKCYSFRGKVLPESVANACSSNTGLVEAINQSQSEDEDEYFSLYPEEIFQDEDDSVLRSPPRTFKATVRLPKVIVYSNNYRSEKIFDEKSFEQDFMHTFRREMYRRRLGVQLHYFEYFLEDDHGDDALYLLKAEGDEDIIKEFQKRARAWGQILYQVKKQDLLLSDPRTIVVDLETKSASELGVDPGKPMELLFAEHLSTFQHSRCGLLIQSLHPDGTVASAIGGHICKDAAAIIAVNGKFPCSSMAEVKKALNRHGQPNIVTFSIYRCAKLNQKLNLNKRLLSQTPYFNRAKAILREIKTRHTLPSLDSDDSFLEYPAPGFKQTSSIPAGTKIPSDPKSFSQAAQDILNNEQSVVIHLSLPKLTSLGATLYFLHDFHRGNGRDGSAWLHTFVRGGTLSTALGDKFGNCGVLFSRINGQRVFSTEEFWKEKSKGKDKTTYELQMVCFDGVDLSHVKRAWLTQPPRRLNGEKYPLKLHPHEGGSSGNIAVGSIQKEVTSVKDVISIDSDDDNKNYHPFSSKQRAELAKQASNNQRTRTFETADQETRLSLIEEPLSREPQNGRYRTKLCRHFVNGTCRFGDKCFFIHERVVPTAEAHEETAKRQLEGYAFSRPKKLTRIEQFVEFQHSFDCSKPLGAYFQTVMEGSRKMCKVTSICFGGAVDRDKRIQPGSVVEAVLLKGGKTPIHTHFELSKKYFAAAKLKTSLRLLFKSPVKSIDEFPKEVDRNWSHDGKWTGEDLKGWAGGAFDPWSQYAKVAVHRRLSTTPSSHDDTPKVAEVGTEITIPTQDEGTSERTTERRKSVSFGPSKALVIDGRQENPSARLRYAVEMGGCRDVIAVLENDVSQDGVIATHGIDEAYKATKEMMEENQRQLGFDPLSSRLLIAARDLAAKKTVLNIYLNSLLILEKASTLEHWGCFELRLLNADFRMVPGIRAPLKISAKIRMGVARGATETLAEIPFQNFTEFMVFDSESNRTVRFNNNASLSMEQRRLEVEFCKQDDRVLCRFIKPMNWIVKQCVVYGQLQTCDISVDEPNYELKSGELIVEVKRIRLDRTYAQKKAHEVAQKFLEQLQNIERFNYDHMNDGLALDPNIRGPGSSSFLGATITLMKPHLLDRLKRLGARFQPTGANDSSNPLAQAKAARDRAQQKLKDMEGTAGADAVQMNARAETVKVLDEMIGVLRGMS